MSRLQISMIVLVSLYAVVSVLLSVIYGVADQEVVEGFVLNTDGVTEAYAGFLSVMALVALGSMGGGAVTAVSEALRRGLGMDFPQALGVLQPVDLMGVFAQSASQPVVGDIAQAAFTLACGAGAVTGGALVVAFNVAGLAYFVGEFRRYGYQEGMQILREDLRFTRDILDFFLGSDESQDRDSFENRGDVAD